MSSILWMLPIFAVLPEPGLSPAIFHFSAMKNRKLEITDVMECRSSKERGPDFSDAVLADRS
jgi:hypothetical protein